MLASSFDKRGSREMVALRMRRQVETRRSGGGGCGGKTTAREKIASVAGKVDSSDGTELLLVQ